jgi:hypothetical protein
MFQKGTSGVFWSDSAQIVGGAQPTGLGLLDRVVVCIRLDRSHLVFLNFWKNSGM